MTNVAENSWSIWNNLRAKCLIIGYLNLIASVVNTICHVTAVFIATYGFQCDADRDSLRAVDWPWLDPLLVVINLGTHGFYPIPFPFLHYTKASADYMQLIPDYPTCYPGMVHVYVVDMLNFLINIIWLKIVISFLSAVQKKNPEPMRLFFGLSVIKLALEIMYFAYLPDFNHFVSSWAFKITDIFIASLYLMIVNKYIIQLRREKAQKTADQPPSYIECLVNATQTRVDEKKDAVLVIEEKEINMDQETKQKS